MMSVSVVSGPWEWECLLAEPEIERVVSQDCKIEEKRRKGLTLHCRRATLNPHEHGHDGVGDAVVEHVALPLEFHLAAVAVADRHATHD